MVKNTRKASNAITIIGAGLGGSFLAVCLSKMGFHVTVYEARPDLRVKKNDTGRSFNLTLYYRGIRAMKKMGLWEDVKKIAIVAQGNVCHLQNQPAFYDPFDKQNEVLYTVHRTSLNQTLITAAEKKYGVKFVFNTKCLTIDRTNRVLTLQNTISKRIFEKKSAIVIGSDGVNSVVRSVIQAAQETNHRQEYSDWGYKEVHVKPEIVKALGWRGKATHTWPRPNALLIAFPNPDTSFTLMLNLPLRGEESFQSLNTKEKVNSYVETYFSDLSILTEDIADIILYKPQGTFVSVYTRPWFYKDFLLLIGDAAHGVIPFFGQGMCSAFEDCLVLMELIKKYNGEWAEILPEFQHLRKVNTDTLADISKENLVELRNNGRSPYPIIKNKIDTALNRFFPKFWLPPLYILIAHSDLPYHEAVQQFLRQERKARLSGINLMAKIIASGLLLVQGVKKRITVSSKATQVPQETSKLYTE